MVLSTAGPHEYQEQLTVHAISWQLHPDVMLPISKQGFSKEAQIL